MHLWQTDNPSAIFLWRQDLNRSSPAYRWNILALLASSQAIAYIDDDELVEVTPKAIRMRKRVLNADERGKARKRANA